MIGFSLNKPVIIFVFIMNHFCGKIDFKIFFYIQIMHIYAYILNIMQVYILYIFYDNIL